MVNNYSGVSTNHLDMTKCHCALLLHLIYRNKISFLCTLIGIIIICNGGLPFIMWITVTTATYIVTLGQVAFDMCFYL